MDTNTPNLIDIFDETKQCVYKGETYMVRDNGAIMRCTKLGCKKRPKDNVWTFGNKSEKGYMKFVKEFVHRIVATAFLGLPPSDDNDYVVDHIDTNRCNNRPENLRWVTKLENMLNNEITLRKIVDCCGSVEAFIENPSMLNNYTHLHPSFDWMKTVPKEQARNAYNNLTNWAKDTRKSIYFDKNKFTDSIFEPIQPQMVISESHTNNALQKNWLEKMTFPSCPCKCSLKIYSQELEIDAIFAKSDNYTYTIVEKKYEAEREAIYLILHCNCSATSFVVAIVTINAKKQYLHEILNKCTTLSEAKTHFERLTFRFEFTKGETVDYGRCDLGLLSSNNEEDWRNNEEDWRTQPLEYTPTITESLTKNAIQYDWTTPTEFPLCPSDDVILDKYYQSLSKEKVFAKNTYGESVIIDFAKYKNEEAFGVVTKLENIKPYGYCKVYIKEAKYVHDGYGLFFDVKGAQRCLVSAQGMKWTGGEVSDDLIM